MTVMNGDQQGLPPLQNQSGAVPSLGGKGLIHCSGKERHEPLTNAALLLFGHLVQLKLEENRADCSQPQQQNQEAKGRTTAAPIPVITVITATTAATAAAAIASSATAT